MPSADRTSPPDPIRPVTLPRVSPAGALLAWRTRLSFGRTEATVLALYIAVLAFTLPHHEKWSDEAQAWILARDNSVWQILRYRLHYEGAPGLWHLILRAFHLLGGQYGGIGWLGAFFAAGGAAVLLRWSPFPLLIRILLPSTFFLLYQYGVIARGYTLFPLLAFTLCILFRSRRSSLWFALIAGLLANISLQGAVFSFMMVCLYLYERLRVRDRRESNRGGSRPLLSAAALYLTLLAIAAVVAVPAPDCGIAHGPPVTTGFVHDLTMRFPGPLPESERPPQPPANISAIPLPTYPVYPPDPPRPEPPLLASPGAWAVWYINHDEFDRSGRIEPRPFTQPLLQVLIEVLTLATAPVASSKILACLFLLILALWLRHRRSLRLLLPWLANITVGEALWIADHHTGMLWIALLTAIWLAASEPLRTTTAGRLDRSFVVLLTLVCAGQIAWSVVSIRNDIYKPYDPSAQTAGYLHAHPHPLMASFDFETVGVEPYFAANPFFNFRHAYWVWNTGENPDGNHFTTLEQHPGLVLFTEDRLAPGFMHNDWVPFSATDTQSEDRDRARNPIILDLAAHGYRETHRFCGQRFMRFSASYQTCNLIFEPASDAIAPQVRGKTSRYPHRKPR